MSTQATVVAALVGALAALAVRGRDGRSRQCRCEAERLDVRGVVPRGGRAVVTR